MEKRTENLIWVLVGLVAIIATVAIVTSIFFGGWYSNGTYGPYPMMGGYTFYGMGLLMPIIGIVSLVFVVIFVYFLITSISGSTGTTHGEQARTPESIARERYARGEISEDEYNNIIEKLRR